MEPEKLSSSLQINFSLDDLLSLQNHIRFMDQEMDRFVYQSAHGLRGPLATIKGLLYLYGLDADSSSRDEIVNRIGPLVDQLDDKLYKLILFSELNREAYPGAGGEIVVERLLRKLNSEFNTSKNKKVDFILRGFDFNSLPINGFVMEGLIINFICYLLTAPIKAGDVSNLDIEITLEAKDDSFLDLAIKSFAIDFNEVYRKYLEMPHGYADLLQSPELYCVFAVQKILYQVKGRLSYSESLLGQMEVRIAVPFNTILT